jgi:hypothetical protein
VISPTPIRLSKTKGDAMTDGMLAALVVAVGAALVALIVSYAARQSGEQSRGRSWLVPVLVLGLPAEVAALVHLVFGYPGLRDRGWPGLWEDVVFWLWIVGGMLGFLFTPAALIVTLVGSWRATAPARTRAAMWVVVVPSMLALAYLTWYFRP